MRRASVAVALVHAVLGMTAGMALGAPTASANPLPAPPYVSRAGWSSEWTQWGRRPSLQVFPTPAGRAASLAPHSDDAAAEAWSEVLTLAPDAATRSMHAQFLCHWHFAEFARPGKTSWNLEPWRPEVSDDAMVGAGCNPGGPEEGH